MVVGDTLWVRRGEGITTRTTFADDSTFLQPSQPDDFAQTLLGHILAFDRDLVPGVTPHGWITKETEPSGAGDVLADMRSPTPID